MEFIIQNIIVHSYTDINCNQSYWYKQCFRCAFVMHKKKLQIFARHVRWGCSQLYCNYISIRYKCLLNTMQYISWFYECASKSQECFNSSYKSLCVKTYSRTLNFIVGTINCSIHIWKGICYFFSSVIAEATEILSNSTGNFYVNDKSTGSVVCQQPFGGARKSGKYIQLVQYN